MPHEMGDVVTGLERLLNLDPLHDRRRELEILHEGVGRPERADRALIREILVSETRACGRVIEPGHRVDIALDEFAGSQ